MDTFLLSITFGLMAMLGWGVGDFFAAIVSRKINPLKALFWTRTAGLILASFYLLKTTERVFLELSFILPLIFAGLLDFIGTLSFFKGFAIGQVSIVSPIAASWALITLVLSIVFLKESLSLFQLIAVFLIIIGIWLTSMDLKKFLSKKKINFFQGGKEGLVAMLVWGVMAFLFISVSKKTDSWYLPIMIYRSFGVIFLALFSFFTKKQLSLKKKNFVILKMIILAGLLDVLSNFSLNFGALIGQSSIVSPVASAYAVPTAILGIIFFKEKLIPSQIFGIISVIVGIVMLSI